MWPWIKRWRDWAMNDLWSMHRSSPQPHALHYSYEKAGLTLHDQPIPWNAEAVLVEALVRLPPGSQRRKADFQLRHGRYDCEHSLAHWCAGYLMLLDAKRSRSQEP